MAHAVLTREELFVLKALNFALVVLLTPHQMQE